MTKKYNIAVVGATGMVGGAVLSILEERKFPIDQLYVLASKRSAGEICEFNGNNYRVLDLSSFDFSRSEICFFCVSSDLAEEYVPLALQHGNVVIDKSACFRYEPEVPLIIPEVNFDALATFSQKNLIASPNCSTIPIVMTVKPIHEAVGISRINVATYQSVSGTGKDAVNELADQTAQLLNGREIHSKVYSQQIAFNVLPHIDEFLENGYTKEEMKIVWETQKILNDSQIAINPTAVRVPVFYGHSAAVHIETKQKITVSQAKELIQTMPGVSLIEGEFPYPTPVMNAAGKDEVFVGRVREDISCVNGLNLWVVGDNVRKGAALNAIQIAERIVNS